MLQEQSKLELLRSKYIFAILDGDTKLGTLNIKGRNTNIEISMPYLSGKKLCEISTRFGLAVSYESNSSKSRWNYLDDLFLYCIKNERASDLLSFIFSQEQFVDTLIKLPKDEQDEAYAQIINKVIDQINDYLHLGGNKLVQIQNKFVIQNRKTNISVAAPLIKKIDRKYVKDLSDRALNDVARGEYDSAITKSRTLLEEVFCYVIEQKGDKPSESGNIGKLYSQVKQLYNMHQSKEIDKSINELLSGLEKILSAIAEMRNKESDSHGVGAKRMNIEEHHARLFVNSAMTMADFILAISNKSS